MFRGVMEGSMTFKPNGVYILEDGEIIELLGEA